MKGNPIFSVEVHIDFSIVQNYLRRRDGFTRDFFLFTFGFLLTLATCALQIVLPSSFHELPIFPAVLFQAWLACRKPPFALFWSVFAGFLLDCGSFETLGPSSLFLVLSSIAAKRAALRIKHHELSIAGAGAVSTFCWQMLRLIFLSNGMPTERAFLAFPHEVLLATLLGAVAGAPLVFGLMDLIFPPKLHKYK